MALSRAIESRKPSSERICFDPYAERFLGGAYRAALFARPLRDGVERLIESMFAGHHWYVVARTRCFDDFLQQRGSGAEQLVILGAGFDSRAHRFADELKPTAIFEVDHPATSAAKKTKMGHVLGAVEDRVTYVPVDFNRESLADRLRQCGYRDGRRTVFLWEGVTPYLNAAAVDSVLEFIRSSASAGSAVLFDYIVQSLLAGKCEMRGARNEFEKMSRSAEPFTFGIAEGQAGAYLAARGFRDAVDVGATELKANYFARFPDRYVKPWWRIVHAYLG